VSPLRWLHSAIQVDMRIASPVRATASRTALVRRSLRVRVRRARCWPARGAVGNRTFFWVCITCPGGSCFIQLKALRVQSWSDWFALDTMGSSVQLGSFGSINAWLIFLFDAFDSCLRQDLPVPPFLNISISTHMLFYGRDASSHSFNWCSQFDTISNSRSSSLLAALQLVLDLGPE
jgi:hypothetical protein